MAFGITQGNCTVMTLPRHGGDSTLRTILKVDKAGLVPAVPTVPILLDLYQGRVSIDISVGYDDPHKVLNRRPLAFLQPRGLAYLYCHRLHSGGDAIRVLHYI